MYALRSWPSFPMILIAPILLALAACQGDVGPTGPTGPTGLDGADGAIGPMYVLSDADLIGTWTGDMLTEDGTGLGFISAGTRTITFDSDGTYTSDIFPNGTASWTGSYIVIGSSVAVTVTNPLGIPFLQEFTSVTATADSLSFILGTRPTGCCFGTGARTAYSLARQ